MILAVGTEMIVTGAVAVTGGHPPLAGIVYVIVYVPGALVFGVIAPVVVFIIKPVVELYVPPGYAPLPLNVTNCDPVFVQNDAAEYHIVAVGNGVTVTVVVELTAEHPFAAGIV